MFLDQVGIEAVVPGGNGRVRRENNLARNARDGGVKPDAFIFHPHANGFEDGEGAVTFVEVKDARSNSESFQGAQSTHAEEQLLANANAQVASVQS